jgi:diguanylate cyclase (GGDEF)-like protein
MVKSSIQALIAVMQPRDYKSAGRAAWVLCLVGMGVAALFWPLQPGARSVSVGQLGVAAGTLAALAAIIWRGRRLRDGGRLAWATAPLLAVVTIVELDYFTSDVSVSAQIFFLFPALYGSWQLPRAGAVVVTAAALAGEWAVVGGMLPLSQAVTGAGYVTAALVTTSVLLIRSGERQADLVEHLTRQAAIDPLTGLVTRRVLDEAAQSALLGAASEAGTSLILLDVDNFKTINDTYGHPAGDQVLVQLAALLVGGAGPNEVVSRMGGDEIALLLRGSSVESLQCRADQILWDVRAHEFTVSCGDLAAEQQLAPVSVSVGTAHAPTHAVDLHELYVAADAALYDAKHSGRDRVGAPRR